LLLLLLLSDDSPRMRGMVGWQIAQLWPRLELTILFIKIFI